MTTHLSPRLSKLVNSRRPNKFILDVETAIKIVDMLKRPDGYNPELYIRGNEFNEVWESVDSSDGRSYTSFWAILNIPATIWWQAEIGKKMISYHPQLPEQRARFDYKWEKYDSMGGYILPAASRLMPKEFRVRRITNLPEEITRLKVDKDEYACFVSEVGSFLTPSLLKDLSTDFVRK